MVLAEIRAKNILVIIDCAMPRVYYPHRKTPDVYGAMIGASLRCFQCESDVSLGDFWAHIRTHDTSHDRDKKPIIVTDGVDLWHVEETVSQR